MRQRLPISALLPILTATLLLSACGSDDTKADADKDQEKSAPPAPKAKMAKVDPICPQVAVVRGLDVVRDYGNEKPDPTQLVSAAKLDGVEGDCEYKKDGIDVAFDMNMTAKRGPRLGGLRASFPVFVAVLNPAGDVLNKDQITVEVKFSSDENLNNHAEAMHVFIPLPKDQHELGPFYKVLSGFQLTPDQAEEAKKLLK